MSTVASDLVRTATMQCTIVSSASCARTEYSRYMGLRGSALRTAIGLTAGLCFLAFGYGQGDIGGLLIVSSFRQKFPEMDATGNPTFHVSLIAGAVVATWNLGCMAGALLTIFIVDNLGRKGTIIAGLVLEIIGKVVQASSFSFGQYIAGRFIAGIGNGFIASTVPAWQAECLKTHRRGTLLMVSFGTCITAGLAMAYWIDYGLSFTAPNPVSWRFPVAFPIVFILAALVMMMYLPESPRYLILNGREQEALSVLSALNETRITSEDTKREFLMMKHAIIRMASGGSFLNMFTMGKNRYLHRTLLAVALQIMSQFTGVNLFVQYLGGMFRSQLQFEAEMSLLLAGSCSTAFFLASLVAVIGLDRFWGRRALTMFGAAGMCMCMIVLAALASLGTQNAYYGMAAFLFVYTSFFSFGWQGMSWLWAVELIPLNIRGPANALSTAANWLSNFLVVLLTPVMFTNITYRTYVFFAVCNFAFIPSIYFFYPETGSRSLEEVDTIFSRAAEGSNPALSVVSISKEEPRWYDKDGEYTESYIGDSEYSSRMEKQLSIGSSQGESCSADDSV